MEKIRPVLLGLMIVFAAAAPLAAQTPTGKIFGTVVDDQGTALPGVTVEASSPKLVGSRSRSPGSRRSRATASSSSSSRASN
jgi:hypothetical protein